MSPKTVRNCASVPAHAAGGTVMATTRSANKSLFMNFGEQFCRRDSALSNQRPQCSPQLPVVGHDPVFVFPSDRLVPEIAPGAFEDQAARRNVPQSDAGLEVPVHPP